MASSRRTTRSHFRSLRLTPGELAVIRDKAHAAGLPVSTYLRRVALGKRVRARRGQVDRDAIYHLSKVGNNLTHLKQLQIVTG